MKYILKLHRFDMSLKPLEKRFKILERIKDEILVETKESNIHQLKEIKETILLKLNWTRFTTMKDFVSLCSKYINGNYNIKVRFLEKNKFSSGQIRKKLNSYMKKQGKRYSENGELIYIEFLGDKFRLGRTIKKDINVFRKNFNYEVVLENPITALEVSDMVRVCYVFDIPLTLFGNEGKLNKVLERAKKITKGVDFTRFEIKIKNKFPEFSCIGFSKYGSKNEKDLFNVLSNKKIGLVFGNETYGLSQELRNKLDLYRLTPSVKKPLKASQALSYVLGIDCAKDL